MRTVHWFVCPLHTEEIERSTGRCKIVQAIADITADERLQERYRIIGRKIAYFRRLQGYTQEQLATQIGISSNYLSQIECGKRKKYTLNMLIAVSELLNVPLKELIE